MSINLKENSWANVHVHVPVRYGLGLWAFFGSLETSAEAVVMMRLLVRPWETIGKP